MSIDLRILAWSLVLAAIHVLLPAALSVRANGAGWGVGPRDDRVPPGRMEARLRRARDNMLETLPLFAIAVLITHAAGHRHGGTATGAWLYLLGRIAFLPLYAAGVPVARTLAWLVSVAGIAVILIPLL